MMRASVAVIGLMVSLALVVPLVPDSLASVSATTGETGTVMVVTTTADELLNNGNCSLREAVQAVNTHTSVDACGDGNVKTIELPSGVYTLTLAGSNEDDNATGDLDVKSDVTIQGTGVNPPWVDGNDLDRVLQVHASTTVTITGVMIRSGRAPDGASNAYSGGDGGGIANAGMLTMIGCDVENNRAGNGSAGNWEQINGGDGGRGGGIFNTGTLILENSVVCDNVAGTGGDSGEFGSAGEAGHGGGIYNTGRLLLKDSTIHDNSTAIGGRLVSPPGVVCGSGGHGGGIYNVGGLTVDGSTIHRNRTANSDNCGGTHAIAGDGGYGGGIYNANTLELSNSTLSGNITGDGGAALVNCGDGGAGGGIYNTGVLTIDNGTITDNATGAGGEGSLLGPGEGGDGGGIYSVVTTIQVRNTILAGNLSAHTGPDCSGTLTSVGYNLIQAITGCTIVGDIVGNLVGVDPRLLPLADNSGPTWTHALRPGSLAVDAGSCTSIDGAVIVVDQRDIGRPLGVTCDIGAYETPVFPKVYLPVVLR